MIMNESNILLAAISTPQSIPNRNEKRTYTVEEIQNILDISRTTAYAIIKRNLFHSVRIGGHIRISKKSFDEWLDSGASCQVCETR